MQQGLTFFFFFCRGLDPPEKPSVIKTESLRSEEPTFNQIIIQDNADSDITTYNDESAAVETVTNRRNTAASLSNNNCLGNTGKISESKGQMKQQACRRHRGVDGVLPANSHSNWGTDDKKEQVCNQEYLDDDDDILAAVADDDYFAMEEDFDMEQIDQLEMGTLNTASKTDEKTTTAATTANSNNNDLEMFYDDEIFEDDFVEEDLLAEATDSVDIRPLRERICNEGTVGTMHSLKKGRTSNSSLVEFSIHSMNTSSSNSINTQIQSDGNSRKLQGCTSNSVKTEPVLLMNNSTFNSCNIFINTGQCHKPKNAVAKSTVVTNPNNLYSIRQSVNQASSIVHIKNEPDNESKLGLENDDIYPTLVDTNQHHQPNVHNIHGAQGNINISYQPSARAVLGEFRPEILTVWTERSDNNNNNKLYYQNKKKKVNFTI